MGEICSFINVKFYFDFQKFFIVDRFVLKFFSFLSQTVSDFSISHHRHIKTESTLFDHHNCLHTFIFESIICDNLIL